MFVPLHSLDKNDPRKDKDAKNANFTSSLVFACILLTQNEQRKENKKSKAILLVVPTQS